MDKAGALRVLEINTEASWEEVRAAYRTVLKSCHPDKFATDPEKLARAEQRTKEINVAYDRLEEIYEAGDWNKREEFTEGYSYGDWSERSNYTRTARRPSYTYTKSSFGDAIRDPQAISVAFGLAVMVFLSSVFAVGRIGKESSQFEKMANLGPLYFKTVSVEDTTESFQQAVYRTDEPVIEPIILAAQSCNLGAVRGAIDRAEIDVQDPAGETALSWAVKRGCNDIVQELLVAGASPTVESFNGYSAVDWARVYKRTGIEMIFAQHTGVDSSSRI